MCHPVTKLSILISGTLDHNGTSAIALKNKTSAVMLLSTMTRPAASWPLTTLGSPLSLDQLKTQEFLARMAVSLCRWARIAKEHRRTRNPIRIKHWPLETSRLHQINSIHGSRLTDGSCGRIMYVHHRLIAANYHNRLVLSHARYCEVPSKNHCKPT